MNRYYLESQIRSVGIAYILFFLVGGHYAYLNKWGYQILFWITLGGIGIWWLIDLFNLSKYVQRHNSYIFEDLARLDRIERGGDDFPHLEELKPLRSENYIRGDDQYV